MLRISISSLIVAATLASCGRPSADQSQSDLTASSASLVKRFYGPNIPAELCLVYEQDLQNENVLPEQNTKKLIGFIKYKGPTGANRFKSRDEIGQLTFVQTHLEGRRLSKADVKIFDVRAVETGSTQITSIHDDQDDGLVQGRTLRMNIDISKNRDLFVQLTIGYKVITKRGNDHYDVVCRLRG